MACGRSRFAISTPPVRMPTVCSAKTTIRSARDSARDRCGGRARPFQVFGEDYETPDGTCLRDYVHVTDLAAAHVLALNALAGGAASTVYNLGNGHPTSVRQVLDAVQRVTGKSVPYTKGPRRAGDPARPLRVERPHQTGTGMAASLRSGRHHRRHRLAVARSAPLRVSRKGRRLACRVCAVS